MKRGFIRCALGIVITATAAYAHHSIAGVYDTSKQVKVDGVITEFHFVNPHPFVLFDVGAQHWRAEMDNLGELVDAGMTRDTFKPGDKITISGSPGRNQPQSLYTRKLDRPSDGFQYEQFGSSPRIRQKKLGCAVNL